MNHALLHRFIQCRNRLPEHLFRRLLVAFGERLAQLPQGGAQTGTGRKHHRMRGALVAAEIALSLTLLVGCGLLLQTINNLHHVTLGYRTDHILVAHLSIPSYRFTGRNLTADLYEPLLERVQHLHGVESAGLISEVRWATPSRSELG